MIEILSLPRRPNLNVLQIKNVTFKTGLPINSLPGWELIPLNSKLPMLKCPGNQVIFSKNKIGQSFRHLKQEFDPSGRDNFPEYNPLHDSNLQTFYGNERNLKRLRQNGEITENNDVICNLKDFNEYRQQLHKTQLYYIQQELYRLEAEQHDRMLISNAEAITNRDHRNLAARKHSYTEIIGRKRKLDTERALHFQRLLQKTEDKFQRINSLAQMQKVLMDHRRVLNHMKMQQHWDACTDIQRKHLISLKKLFQFKKDRLQKNLRKQQDIRLYKAEQSQIVSWNKRLNERISNQSKMKKLLDIVACRKKVFIENHRNKYRDKWTKIQEEIKNRAHQLNKNSKLKSERKRLRKNKKKQMEIDANKDKKFSFCEGTESFEKLMDDNLCEALNAAIDIEDQIHLPFGADDPIYKAAKYILNHIVTKFDKDLSEDKIVFDTVSERVDNFFDVAKKFVMFRASQIIAATRQTVSQGSPPSHAWSGAGDEKRRPTLPKFVSFNRIADTIGQSSYEIHPLMNVKAVGDRTPTPAGSLASLVLDSEESLMDKTQAPHLCRNELIVIEHYITKFKRELIIGMGRRVFGAIQCHFENKIMDVRKELLELDKKFIVCQMTRGILNFAINPIDFECAIKLCVGALSSDIVWSLQKHLLKPRRDPRGIVRPRECTSDQMPLCLFCK